MPFSLTDTVTSIKNAVGNAGKKVQELQNKVFTPSVGTFSFKDVRNLDRPAPTWRWSAMFPEIAGLKLPGLHCESVDIVPGLNIPKVNKYYQGIELPFPGIPSYDSVSAVFYETESYQTLRYFTAWSNLIFNKKRKTYGVPGSGNNGYGRKVVFQLLPVTELADIKNFAEVSLLICWPSNIQRLSYGSTTDRIKIQVDFVFHDLDIKITGTAPDEGTDVASLLNKFTSFRR
jgi:hypothetical protein